MGTYILKRILLFIPTLVAITIVTFLISRMAPGDPAELKAGIAGGEQQVDRQVSEENLERIREKWHLNESYPVQYWYWVSDLVQLDFGNSFKDEKPVLEKILERIPVTLGMSIASIILSYIIAIPVGIYSATNPGTFLDKSSTTLLFMLYSLPSFWVGTLAIIFLCSPDYFNWFPSAGLYSTAYSESWTLWQKLTDVLWHMTLPIIVYTYASFAFVSRQMRGAMLEVVRQDYIRTARAKGLGEKSVILRHALRNSLIPILTLLGGLLPALISGSIIVELIFSIPGMGQLSYYALLERDYPIIMGVLTLSAVLTMIGVLIADLLYSIVDPRIAFSKKGG